MYKLKSGDIILCEGRGLNSKLIKFFTDSNISHAGIVYECPITKALYLWESGDVNESTFPIITKKDHPLNGAHLMPLKNKFNPKHNKKIYVRRIIDKQNKFDQPSFDEYVMKNLGKPYSSNLVTIWTQRGCNPSFINISFIEDNTEFADSMDHDEWTCSQLVVLTYYHLGVVKHFDGPTHTITPGDLFEDIVTTSKYDFGEPELIWECK